jgi:hypothetical protein
MVKQASLRPVFPLSFGDTLMQPYTKNELIEQYREASDVTPQPAQELDLSITVKTKQALTKGQPVPPSQLADLWEMPIDRLRAILEQVWALPKINRTGWPKAASALGDSLI